MTTNMKSDQNLLAGGLFEEVVLAFVGLLTKTGAVSGFLFLGEAL
jgi:hypothetical protein